MPPVQRPRPTRKAAAAKRAVTGVTTKGVDTGVVTPEEIASIRSSVQGKEQAPSSRQQAGANINWAKIREQLGDPFDVERIPLSRLRLMRRDPQLAFGLSFIKTPHARSKFYINAKSTKGPNAQVAGNVDWAMRRIFASYVLQHLNCLDFGFQGMAKRYELRTPSGTFIDTSEGGEKTEQPLWSEGKIQPIVWKPFVALPPEKIEPIWSNSGEFDGILYSASSAPGGIGASATGSDKEEFKIDLYHSLWATHDQEQNMGSIFGYPRLGYAFRHWWSYWLRWAIADQAFEKKADPSIIVRHPDGQFELEDGSFMEYRNYALEMGERMRSGATISLPSDVYMGEIDGKPSSVRMWDIETVKDATNFEPFDKSFSYLDIAKIRALWIPEQSLMEGGGGTSSRNVAGEMFDSFTESQAVLSNQIVDTLNRWVIPQFLAVNFPEFVAEGGTAEIVMTGFADQDIDARNQILQLIGQQDSGSRELLKIVDLQRMCEDAGVPILNFKEQQQREQELAKELQTTSAPPAIAPVPGDSVGVVPSSTGFSYIKGRDPMITVTLTDASVEFLEGLPNTHQYQDAQVKKAARELHQQWFGLYGEEYKSFANFLAAQEDVIQFAETLSPSDIAKKIVEAWESNSKRLSTVIDRTTDIYKRVMRRASFLEAKSAKLDAELTDAQIEQWISDHAGKLVTQVTGTTRDELTAFVAKHLADGYTTPQQLAEDVRTHFEQFPSWKADRLARTEIREAYNAATLLTARAANVDQVQAVDGESDPECLARNGKLYTVDKAFAEKEHPNGTLGWKIPAVALSVDRTDEDLPGGAIAVFDEETNTVTFSNSIDRSDENRYLLTVVEAINS